MARSGDELCERAAKRRCRRCKWFVPYKDKPSVGQCTRYPESYSEEMGRYPNVESSFGCHEWEEEN